jgi:hypothetical protein
LSLRANGCSGTYSWYNASSGGTLVGTSSPLISLSPYPTDFTTPSISATTTYYVDCTVGACTSTRTAVNASVISPPKANCVVSAPGGHVNLLSFGYSSFSFAGISDNSGSNQSGNYKDKTCAYQAIVNANGTYSLNVQSYQQLEDVKVYIDYNNDGDFNYYPDGNPAHPVEDPSELVIDSYTQNSTGTFSITIPSTAIKNTTLRMRVIVTPPYGAYPCSLEGGTNTGTGVAVDFSVLILAPNPVSFVSFAGQALGGQNLLKWQTSEETQNKGFEIERSPNAKGFERIGFVQGQSDSRDLQTYTFIDSQPLNSTNYYRLKQLDNDGHFAYSRTVAIVSEADNSFLVFYPNPTADEITVKSDLGTVKEAQIMTLNGTVLMSKAATTEAMIFSLKNIPSGTYLLNVAIDDYYVTKKIIKQ